MLRNHFLYVYQTKLKRTLFVLEEEVNQVVLIQGQHLNSQDTPYDKPPQVQLVKKTSQSLPNFDASVTKNKFSLNMWDDQHFELQKTPISLQRDPLL